MSTQGQKIRTISPSTCLSEYLIYAGAGYEFVWTDPAVASAGTIYAVAKTSLTKYTILNFRQVEMDQERGFFTAHTSFDEGIVIGQVPVRSLRVDASPSPLTVDLLDGATSIDPASQTLNQPLFGSPGGGPTSSSGTLARESALRIVPPGTEFLAMFDNASVAATYFQATLRWFELSPDAMPMIRDL